VQRKIDGTGSSKSHSLFSLCLRSPSFSFAPVSKLPSSGFFYAVLSRPRRSPTSSSSFSYQCPLPDPTSTLSLPSRFTNALSLFSPSCRRMRSSSRRLVAARHRRRAMVDHRQPFVDMQPVKSRGATAVSVPAQDVQSGTISSTLESPPPSHIAQDHGGSR
jgi:hypothetical protein